MIRVFLANHIESSILVSKLQILLAAFMSDFLVYLSFGMIMALMINM